MPHDSELPANYLSISLSRQQLELFEDHQIVRQYVVSTAKNGPGEAMDSECTPTGWHQIRAKIGTESPPMTVFSGRRPTGECFTAELFARYPERDWILTRILWLSGLEPGRNRFGDVDSAWRYIYIHGSPDQYVNGRPSSHGCIRMRNADILDVYQRVPIHMRVLIG